MTAAPALWAVGQDMVWCLGFGLLLAAARDLLGVAAGNGRVLSFLWDLLAFAAAAVLLCGFTASASAGGVSRWYMAAAMGVGALAWHWVASGWLHRLVRGISGTCLAATLRLQRLIAAPFSRIWSRYIAQKQEKKAKNPSQKVTKRKKQLQKQRKVLYN